MRFKLGRRERGGYHYTITLGAYPPVRGWMPGAREDVAERVSVLAAKYARRRDRDMRGELIVKYGSH